MARLNGEDDLDRDTEDEEDPVELLDELLSHDTAAPLPPVAHDGGFTPQPMGEAAPIPEATAGTMCCMAGPCRYYIEQLVWFASGNTEGSPGYNARESVRYCDRLRSAYVSLTDEVVFECIAWDPIDEAEVKARAERKERLAQIRRKAS